MIKYLLNLLNLIIFFLILNFFTPLMANKNDDSDNLYLKKLKEYERSQKEIDLIFSEYCHFHDDSICYEEEINDEEIDITKNNEGTIYYTSANVNLREKPSTNSTVLILILKNQPITIYEVSNENNNWFLAEYNEIIGYVSSDYITKNKPSTKQITKNNIVKDNNTQSSEDDLDWDEYIMNETNECKASYDPINSINLRDNHEEYCSCYPRALTEVTTSEDIKYIELNEEASEEFIEKINEVKYECAVKTNYYFDFEVSEELQEAINKDIKECKSKYTNDAPLSRKKFNKICTCYENKWNSIVTKEDTDYFEKYNKPSDTFIEKQDKLTQFCISELS